MDFQKKGIILVNKELNDEELIYEISIQNGADDISQDENNFIIICKVKDLDNIKKIIFSFKYQNYFLRN